MRSMGKLWRAPLARWVAVGLAALLLGAAGWLGWKGRRALGDVDAMLVPTVVLPARAHVPTPRAAAGADRPAAPTSAPPTAPAPTAIPALDQPLTLLLLGADTRPGDTASRTDAMVVIRVDPRAQRVALLSLPRDLWVTIPGHGQARVNAA